MTTNIRAHAIVLATTALIGCDWLGPRTSDVGVDAFGSAPHLLPAGSVVPSIASNPELVNQIQLYDGLVDATLAMNLGVVKRSPGKAAGAAVMYWNFGTVTLQSGFAIVGPLYVLADDDGAGGFTPRSDHPYLIDALPGDVAYSALRRVTYVPVTAAYSGERVTSLEALAEALDRGLVREPVPAGTWRNMPVVPVGTRLELGGTAAPLAATEVFGRGYRIELFALGSALGIQPLRSGQVPVGHEARLLSGVPTGTPPTLPAAVDAQPVFQYGIPSAPPTSAFNYTPLVTAVDVRLCTGMAPASVSNDSAMFTRGACGASGACAPITAFYSDTVDGYTVTTTVSNKQLQFAEGSP